MVACSEGAACSLRSRMFRTSKTIELAKVSESLRRGGSAVAMHPGPNCVAQVTEYNLRTSTNCSYL